MTVQSLRISTAAAGPQSRARKRFNTLIKQLERERQRIAEWHDAMPRLRELAEREYAPLEREYDALRKEMLLLADRAIESKGMGKRNRVKLTELIEELAVALLDGGTDDEVQRVYDKHFENPFGQDDERELQGLLDELLRETAAARDGGAGPERLDERGPGAAPRGVGRKPTAREAKQQVEAEKLRQSVREVYRKLASALHPDRERDEAERARKTALMQRVNVAYENDDLLGLLELQFEVEQIDQSGLDGLGEERVAQYNKVLDKQLSELRVETLDLEMRIAASVGMGARGGASPRRLTQALRAEIVELRANVARLRGDLADLADPQRLKVWLKYYQPAPAFDDIWF